MLSPKFRSKLLLSLFVLAVILLAINILINSNFNGTNSQEQILDSKEIRGRFLTILDNLGIEDKLIKEDLSKDKSTGRMIPFIKIQVPQDLSIPEVLQDIYQSFAKDSLIISSVEKVKGGRSTLALIKGKTVILRAEFNYAKNIFRNKGSFAFILKNADLEEPSTSSLIESSSKLNFLIRPDSKYIQILNLLRENNKQFSILIDDDISEQKFKLGAKFSKQRIIAVLQTVLKDFGNAVSFVIDEKSDFYKSSNRLVLEKELSKRHIKLFTSSDFVNLENNENVVSSFQNVVENRNPEKGLVILLDEASYLAISPEIEKYKKRGYKILNSSQLL